MPAKKESLKTDSVNITVTTKKTVARKNTKMDYNSEIMERAFDLYLERIKSGNSGDDVNDWLIAEQEIRRNHRL